MHKVADLTLERVRGLETRLEQVNDKTGILVIRMDDPIDMLAATRADISPLHTRVAGANTRLDRVEKRVERLETRLDVVPEPS